MILIGFGSNKAGRWGPPGRIVNRLLPRLEELGIRTRARSGLVLSDPVGPGRQEPYVNGVLCVAFDAGPRELMRRLKRLESSAGRAPGPRWRSRPLDLDILSFEALVRGWRGGRPDEAFSRSGNLILPHARLHVRPFVLKPMLDVAADWVHPVLGLSTLEMWRSVERRSEGRVLQHLRARPKTPACV